MEDRIFFRVIEGLFIIKLNDSLKLNSLSFDDFNYIAGLLEKSESNPETNITVIESSGPFFSAGGKLEIIAGGSKLTTGELVKEISAPNIYVSNVFATHSKPLVCFLNGPAVGLAASLVMLCDIVFAINESVYLSFPFSALGFVPELLSSVTLPWKLGINSSYEHLVFSKPINYQELFANGIIARNFGISQSVKNATQMFNEQAEDVLKELSKMPASLQGIKKLLSSSQIQSDWMSKGQSIEVATTLPYWISGEPFKRFRKLLNRKQSKL